MRRPRHSRQQDRALADYAIFMRGIYHLRDPQRPVAPLRSERERHQPRRPLGPWSGRFI